jgi:hypothetical protein
MNGHPRRAFSHRGREPFWPSRDPGPAEALLPELMGPTVEMKAFFFGFSSPTTRPGRGRDFSFAAALTHGNLPRIDRFQ